MTAFFAFLFWLLGSLTAITLAQVLILKHVQRTRNRTTPCIPTGIVFSLVRQLLLLQLVHLIFDLAFKEQIMLTIVVVDVLFSAIYAFCAFRRYGSYARRTGFRTGLNIGSLCFGLLFFIWL